MALVSLAGSALPGLTSGSDGNHRSGAEGDSSSTGIAGTLLFTRNHGVCRLGLGLESLVGGMYEHHGVLVVRVVAALVHTGHRHELWVLQVAGHEGTSGYGAVPLHGVDWGEGIVEVCSEVVDMYGVRPAVTVAHGGQGDGDTAGDEGGRVGGENMTAGLGLAAHIETFEDSRDSVTKLHLGRTVPRSSPDLALRPRQGQAGGLHDVTEGLPLAGRHLVVTSEVQEQQLAGTLTLRRRHLTRPGSTGRWLG